MAAYREMQLEIQAQKEREKRLLEEQKAKEEEVLMVESQYHDLQEEVEDMRKLIKSFRVRYKQAIQEIKDLNQEHCKERQDLFQNC